MKVKNNNELWIQNSGKTDIKVADLNVKVRAGTTVNVYKYNPYLTVSQVEDSLKSGSLSRKLKSNSVKIVQGRTVQNPAPLKTVDEDKNPLVKKVKSSVVIEQENNDPEESGNFDFADYGIADLGPVEQVKEGNTVSVRAKQDEKPKPKEDPDFEPAGGLSMQSQMIMQDRADKEAPAYGKVAGVTSNRDQPFSVTTPDLTPEVDEATGAVTIKKAKEAKTSYLDKIKRAQESGVLDDDEEGADRVVDMEPTEFDTKAATVTEDGSVIMKIKEKE